MPRLRPQPGDGALHLEDEMAHVNFRKAIEDGASLEDLAGLARLDRYLDNSTLDAAWAEAEAALPEGWRFRDLANAPTSLKSGRWLARADGPGRGANAHARGHLPADALRALAANLRAHPGTARP